MNNHSKKVTKIEVVPDAVKQSRGIHTLKIECCQKDAFGNNVVVYNKETVTLDQLNDQISRLKKKITELNQKKELIKASMNTAPPAEQ